MNRCWLKAHWIVSAIELISSSSRVTRIENEPHLRRKTENPKPETRLRRNKAPLPIYKDAAARRLLLMSFEGMGKSIRTMEAATHKAAARAHLSDEFPAGYSLTGCSPAVPGSASPTGASLLQHLPKSGDLLNYHNRKPAESSHSNRNLPGITKVR